MSVDSEGCKKHGARDRYCTDCNMVQILKRKDPVLKYDDIKYHIHSYHMSPDKEDLYTLYYVCQNILKKSSCDEIGGW